MKRVASSVVTLFAVIASKLRPGYGPEACERPGLPVKPLMARTTPTAKDLLTPPTYARPDRVDELIKRSEPRRADPFDLPPPTGGAAPAAAGGSATAAGPDDTKVANPGG